MIICEVKLGSPTVLGLGEVRACAFRSGPSSDRTAGEYGRNLTYPSYFHGLLQLATRLAVSPQGCPVETCSVSVGVSVGQQLRRGLSGVFVCVFLQCAGYSSEKLKAALDVSFARQDQSFSLLRNLAGENVRRD
jgi:hypothetical protein